MAIARGAGTEIIRTALFEDIAGTTARDLIVGEAHHIYTVLSMTFYSNAVHAAEANRAIQCRITGYDSNAGTAGELIYLFKHIFSSTAETFVWNDKFSFNGFGPVDFAGPMDDATKQNALADQGGASQKLQLYVAHADTKIDVIVTYIDQNNA